RVAEGQRARAGPGQVGAEARRVGRERRRAARGVDRDDLGEIDRQGDDVAGIQIAAAVGDAGTGRGNRGDRGGGRVDDQRASGIGYRARQVSVGGGRVLNGGAVEIERGHRQSARVLPGQHRVAEGQRARAGPGQV